MNKKHIRISALTSLVIFSGVLVSQIFITQTQAAALTSSKDVISNSRPGVNSSHTFTFTTPSATDIKTVDFQYCTTASGSCTAPTGMSLAATPTLGTVTGIAGATYTPTSTSANCTGTGNTNCTLTVTVTTPAPQTVTPVVAPFDTGVVNPTTDDTTTFVRITTKDGSAVAIDTTTVAFATLTGQSIAMTASVDPTFTFSVDGVASTGLVNTEETNVTATASAIPFGTLTALTPKIAALDTTVVTNAGGGYTITVAAQSNPPMADGNNNIDVLATAPNSTPILWDGTVHPNGVAANVNSGFIGYTTEESALGTGTPDRFTAPGPRWAGLSTTAGEAVYLGNATTTRTKRIGFKVEVNGLQPAGSYTGAVLLVATPTY